MRKSVQRRLLNTGFLLIACCVLLAVDLVGQNRLYLTEFFSGWVLAASVVFLSAISLRKKLPLLPLGRVSLWMQLHIYVGLFSIVAFFVHTGTPAPNGILEIVLALTFGLLALSGVIGLVLSRQLPHRLTRRGEPLLFDRLDGFRSQLARKVEMLVLKVQEEHGSGALPSFYSQWLRPFFSKPRNFWSHIWESRGPSHRLTDRMKALERYLNPAEREILAEMATYVEKKHELDYQYAIQTILKRWLFLHIPLTFGLLVLTFVHLVLVYAFTGAA